MTNWAAVIYGRTYEVDFRILAIPHDFTAAEQDWLVAHLQTMTRNAESLSQRPRWAVFRQDRRCVVAIACMIRELFDPNLSGSIDLTHDQRGRPLYGVLGYVATVAPGEPITIPAYVDHDLSSWGEIYREYVTPHWFAKSYQKEPSIATDYRPLLVDLAIASPIDYPLNLTDPTCVAVWSDESQERQRLWAIAAAYLAAGNEISLCLSLPNSTSALNGAFWNATVDGVEQSVKLRRMLEVSPTANPPSQSSRPSPIAARRQVLLTTLMLMTGASLGGIAGALLGKSIAELQDESSLNPAELVQPSSRAPIALYVLVGTMLGGGGTMLGGMLLSRWAAGRGIRNDGETAVPEEPSLTHPVDPMLGFRTKESQDNSSEDDFMTWR